MTKINFILFTISLLVLSCSKSEADRPNKGEITIATDEAFQNVTIALVERYMAHYPETKINVTIQNENLALMDLLKNKNRVIVMSRELTDKEKKLYQDMVDLPLEPANFAADATVFIVAKNSKRNKITVDEIKHELSSEQKRIIFDGVNASNFNYLVQKLNLDPKKIKYSVIKGNQEIIKQINNYPDNIGVVSLNSISNEYSKEVKQIREKIKILPVVENNISYEPNRTNTRDMTYPFTRVLYFLTNEGYFGLGNGFIRFSCTQKGQIVVSKQGLQPYHIFKREVIMK